MQNLLHCSRNEIFSLRNNKLKTCPKGLHKVLTRIETRKQIPLHSRELPFAR